MGVRGGGGASKIKAVSTKLLGGAVHATSRSDAAPGGEFGFPPKKILIIKLHLVASGSIENDFNNNTLHKLDIVILNVIEDYKA